MTQIIKSAIPINGYFKLLYSSEKIIIDPCDGTKTLSSAKDVFPAGIDGFFRHEHFSSEIATKVTEVKVYEAATDDTFSGMFYSFSNDLDELCFTQHQVVNFCKKYPKLLCQNRIETFFLIKVCNEYFIAPVVTFPTGLDVAIYEFNYNRLQKASNLHRIVIPKLRIKNS
jgi:hypothetical protein